MTNLKLLFLYLFPFTLTAQSVTGKVYDFKSTAKNIGVFNLSTYNYTYTDENGDFTIQASLNDTILFSSEFYKPQKILVQDKHFNTTNVIELEVLVNTLNTVTLSNTSKFDKTKHQANLATQIQNDKNNNPHLYGSPPNPQGNLMILFDAVIGLFKSKKTKENPITYKIYQDLFNTNTFFNEKLLINNLNIKTKHVPLFFDYCDSKKLNTDLLQEQNQMVLLDSLIKFSKAFNTNVVKNDTILITH